MDSSYSFASTASAMSLDYEHNIAGKVVLITGASLGSLGAQFAMSISLAGPSALILAGRNLSRLKHTAESITVANPDVNVHLLQLDLESLAAVRESAQKLNARQDLPNIDVVVSSAGIMAVDFARSPDGYERQFAVNHLGHFLFINLIMDKILSSNAPRVVSISSDGHRLSPVRETDWNFMSYETYDRWTAYGQSKTANMLFAQSLARKLACRNLLAFSLHPGVIFGTGLTAHIDDAALQDLEAADRALGNAEGWADFKTKTLDQGAATYVYASFEPGLQSHNGAYLVDSRIADPSTDTVKPWATDSHAADRLWALSEELVGERFEY